MRRQGAAMLAEQLAEHELQRMLEEGKLEAVSATRAAIPDRTSKNGRRSLSDADEYSGDLHRGLPACLEGSWKQHSELLHILVGSHVRSIFIPCCCQKQVPHTSSVIGSTAGRFADSGKLLNVVGDCAGEGEDHHRGKACKARGDSSSSEEEGGCCSAHEICTLIFSFLAILLLPLDSRRDMTLLA